ncbi:MAG TPA: hypothetical protein VGN98_07780 [Tianweitania sediminis]|jgi:hypothetical protein|nr:hypothetical protein [Tianweitania sediminis]
MKVVILESFEVDTANGRVAYVRGEEVGNGQKNWVEKGLAREVDEIPAAPEPKPSAKSEPSKSAD